MRRLPNQAFCVELFEGFFGTVFYEEMAFHTSTTLAGCKTHRR